MTEELKDRPADKYERKLVEAGRQWARKTLGAEGGRGFHITQGIREGVAENQFTAPEPRAQALAQIDVITALQNQIDATRQVFVNEARQTGASWAAIGNALRISKQAAQQKFGPGSPEHVPARYVDVPLIGE